MTFWISAIVNLLGFIFVVVLAGLTISLVGEEEDGYKDPLLILALALAVAVLGAFLLIATALYFGPTVYQQVFGG